MTPAITAQYLALLHAMACITVLYHFASIGFIIDKKTPKQIMAVLLACIVVPLIQVPLAIAKYYMLAAHAINVRAPIDYYLDFVWSPMMTLILIWLTQVYLGKYCPLVRRVQPAAPILSPIRPMYLLPILALGVASAFALSLLPIECEALPLLVFIGATGVSLFEGNIQRYRYSGAVVVTSYTWIWYVGTWLFFMFGAH